MKKEGIDTLKIARKYLPQLESRGLEYLCRYYGIRHCAHRALEDARATVLLYQNLQNSSTKKKRPWTIRIFSVQDRSVTM